MHVFDMNDKAILWSITAFFMSMKYLFYLKSSYFYDKKDDQGCILSHTQVW